MFGCCMYEEGSKGIGFLLAYGFDLMRAKATTQESLQRTSGQENERRFGGRAQQQQRDQFSCVAKSPQHKDCCCCLQLGLARTHRAIAACFLWFGRQRNSLGRTSLQVILQSPVQKRTDKAAIIRYEYLCETHRDESKFPLFASYSSH